MSEPQTSPPPPDRSATPRTPPDDPSGAPPSGPPQSGPEGRPDTHPDTRPTPGRRAEYAHFLPITTRWMDNDVFGHVNNVVYYSFFDTAVCETLVAHGVLNRTGGEHFLVMAESGCRYHRELAFPDRVTAGLRVASLGRRSVRYEIAVFRGDDDLASAEGFMVHVCVSAADRRPAALPEAWRRVLSGLRAGLPQEG